VARDELMRRLAARYAWWLSSDEALARTTLVLCQLMQLGTWEDVVATRAIIGDDALRQALREAPPGVLDRRSWGFWNMFFGSNPPPPMPERRVPQ